MEFGRPGFKRDQLWNSILTDLHPKQFKQNLENDGRGLRKNEQNEFVIETQFSLEKKGLVFSQNTRNEY
ncbi:hypothetical protein DLM75_22415 [Leptospira stimsonii]|uniref:Uncharacterized protein n=1 Tax=Leptospira stimsonii TaxID=2202203 RepID=A0A396YTH4_9LEPT|nr:hypothetical protein DLM75_22415 [Leptospira stimsonii]